MNCKKCGKKMEKQSKRSYDSYYCRTCGAQVTKINKMDISREVSKDVRDLLNESYTVDFDSK